MAGEPFGLDRTLIKFDAKVSAMKKIKLVLMLLVGVVTVSFGQPKKKALLTISVSTPGVQCEACKNILQQFMAREEGVTKTVVDYKRKVTKVTYWTDRTNPENIKTAIANVGFDADDVTANMEFAKKLPPCCKKI